jgi:predicted nucleic acid-binding protein
LTLGGDVDRQKALLNKLIAVVPAERTPRRRLVRLFLKQNHHRGVVSAAIKQRTGDLDEAARRRAQSTFYVLVRDSATVLDVPRACFARAAEMAGRAELGLWRGDALHLAVAQHHRVQLCTRDERQAQAGRALGIDVFFWRRPHERSRDHRGRREGRARLVSPGVLRHPCPVEREVWRPPTPWSSPDVVTSLPLRRRGARSRP